MTQPSPSFGVLLAISVFASLAAPRSNASAAPVCDREAPGAVAPSWSRDGSKIAYSSKVDGRQIYTARADGGHPKRLTESESDDLYAHYSPDGSKIVFMSTAASGDTAVVRVVDVDGSGARAVTTAPSDEGCPIWSPDSRHLSLYSDRTGNLEVFLTDLEGNERQLTDNPAIDAFATFAPDGRSVVFDSNRDRDPYGFGQGTDLFRLDLATGELERLIEPADFPASAE